jgi:hypothetical protein
MINGAWDVVELIVVLVFWIETRGRTLEEIDGNLDGEIHSDAPQLSTILGMEPEERGEVIEAIGLSKDKELDARTVVTELAK